MKINHLTISGFGPFRTEQKVDFSAFDGDLFLIDGNTGAGKSSLLDAITYALYNNVARYDAKVGEKVRSNYCTPAEKTEVVLDFSLKEGRYRITRNPEYEGLRRNSDRTAVRRSDAILEQFDGDGWVGMSTGLRDVGFDLERILPLSKSQFLQVILLAQNKFAEFLHSPSTERQKLLRALFHTERFDVIEQELRSRKTELEVSLGRVTERVETRSATAYAIVAEAGVAADLLDTDAGSPLTVARLEHYLGKVSTAAVVAAEALAAVQRDEAAAQATHTALSEAKARQEALLSSLEKRAMLEAQADQRKKDELRLEAGERADNVRSALEARDNAEEAGVAAEQARIRTHGVWATHTGAATESSPTSTSLRLEVKALEKTLTELSLAANHESAVTEGEEVIAALNTTIAKLSAESTVLSEQATTLPPTIAAAEAVVRAIALHEVQWDAATSEIEVAKRRLTAADALIVLQARQQELLATEAIRTTESAEASTSLATLLERQLDGYAATLANTLREGEPCMVCGSTAHPQRANLQEHVSVTADDVERARTAEDAARKAQDDARAATTEVSTEMATQAAIADGLGVDQAREALDSSAARLRQITDALATKDASADTLQELTTSLATLTTSIETNRLNLTNAGTKVAAAEQELARAILARDTARAGFANIDDHVASVEANLAVADHYLEALLAFDGAEANLSKSQGALAEALASQNFDTEAECAQSLIPAAALRELRTSTANHRAEFKTHNDIISAAERDGITATPIETAEARDALREAKQQAIASHELNVLAKQRSENLATLVKAARTDEAENAQLLSSFVTVDTLSRLTAGDDPNTFKMRLESFVLAAKLEEIVEAANKRLSSMTQERYALEYDDELAGNAKSGLGISVLDNFTGQGRSAKSLSGGETFLASLALALGLAEVVSSQAGGIRLDTLFIDEGFGALDSGTLAIAMNTIHELRAGGRTIGLISHVEEMKQQIPNKLHVVKTTDGSSKIKTEA